MDSRTLQEIREIEIKLIKLFSKILVGKRNTGKPDEPELKDYPQLEQWLKVVGLAPKTIKALVEALNCFEDQLSLPDNELKQILDDAHADEDEFRKLQTAIKNLKTYTSHLEYGTVIRSSDLYWDSWDRSKVKKKQEEITERNHSSMSTSLSSPRVNRNVVAKRNRITSTNDDSSSSLGNNNNANNTTKSSPMSPPQSASSQNCPWSPSFTSDEDNHELQGYYRGSSPPLTPSGKKSSNASATGVYGSNSKFPTTPPPVKKHQTKLLSEPYPLTKSRSHEEHLSNRIDYNLDGNSSARELISAVTSNSFNSLPPPLLSSPSNQPQGQQYPSSGHQQYPTQQTLHQKKHSQQHHYPGGTHSQHTSPSPCAGHQTRRRLATEPGNLHGVNCSTSPLVSPSRSPPPVSPDQSDSCFDEVPGSSSSSSHPANHSSSIPSSSSSNTVAPRSPRTHAAGMGHVIHHRFCTMVKVTSVLCYLCQKPMYIGLKCKECKYKCHRDCEDKVPPSCGLTQELVNVFKQTIQQQQGHSGQASASFGYLPSSTASSPANNVSTSGTVSEILSPCSVKSEYRGRERRDHSSGQHHSHRHRSKFNGGDLRPCINIAPFGGADSSSNTSSCTSSTPSSPALLGSSNVPTPSSASKTHTFNFPDVPTISSTSAGIASRGSTTPLLPPLASSSTHQTLSRVQPHSGQQFLHHHLPDNRDVLETRRSNDSEKTMSITSGSTDSERTLAGRIDSQDSQISCDLGDDGRSWPRQNSLTSKEWEIPFDELNIEEVIGTGRFGTVFKGHWHGLVAVKRLNLSSSSVDPVSGRVILTPEDKKYMEAFRQEVATFRKTRHDNLVLFMGACMKPPHLAIVTSLCKGATLYTHLHIDKTKFDTRTTPLLIVQQICQGMSYLHARGIVHKDLKTKNIFYDRSNGKVVITDFGLFSVTKLCLGTKQNHHGSRLTIPRGWLCYLAPEIIQSLKPGDQDNDNLPFSAASDVFAFG